MITKLVSWIPSRFRIVAAICVVVLCVFLYSKFTSSPAAAAPAFHTTAAPAAAHTTAPPAAPSLAAHLVEVAVDSTSKAGEASTVVDQLRHLTFGISHLEAAKAHIPSYDKLSSVSGVDIRKLEAYLHRAEQMCVKAIKTERKAPPAA